MHGALTGSVLLGSPQPAAAYSLTVSQRHEPWSFPALIRQLTVILVLVPGPLLACLDPSDPARINGTWNFDEGWSGDSLRCSFVRETLSVREEGGALSGHLTGGVGICIRLGLPFPAKPSGPIAQGRVGGALMTFSMPPQLSYEGRISEAEMRGTLTGSVLLGSPPSRVVPITGTWSAAKF
jgi:hypothetical protein